MKKFLAIILCMISFCGCTPEKQEEKITVYATLFPQFDFCRQIAGDKIELKLLLPSGMESHNYEPGVKDIESILNADMFIYTGAQMEPWAQKILSGIDNNLMVIDASKGIELSEEHHQEHYHIDPHIWTSPKNAKKMAKNILNALCVIDNKNSDYYIKNAGGLFNELDRLDAEFEELSLKAQNKVLCHGGKFSLNYLTKDYGLEFLPAFDSCSNWSEPSVTRIKDIVETIKSQNLKAVFYEELSSGNIAQTISNETGVEKLLLHSCHNVSKEDFLQGATYVLLMEQNIENIKKAIGN
ncbi:MAG: zinc ABC transporter substrate-binding protein [Clostridiales bacterium]|nr:zinc ABC transporter substrate-binding protein [Clostridiales bacterium]